MDRLDFDLGYNSSLYLIWGWEQMIDLFDCPVWAEMRRDDFDLFVDFLIEHDLHLDTIEPVIQQYDAVQETLEDSWEQYNIERAAAERRAQFRVIDGGLS